MDNELKLRRRLKFTNEEDEMLRNLVNEHGESAWNIIASNMPGRNVRQCRERWKHYLSANKSGRVPFTEEEDRIIMEKYIELGPKWTKIAKFVKDRSDIQVKSRIIKNLNSFKETIMAQPQIFNQQINLQTQLQKQETRLEIMPIANETINTQNKLVDNDYITTNDAKEEENGNIRNIHETYCDVPFDFLTSNPENAIEDSHIAENVFYPLDF